MALLYNNAADLEVTVGPFINTSDDSDNTTLGTTNLLNNAKLIFDDAVGVSPTSGSTMTHRHYGYYTVTLQEADVDVVAENMTLVFDHSTLGTYPVWKDFKETKDSVFGAIYSGAGSSLLDVNTQEMNGNDIGDPEAGDPLAEIWLKKISIINATADNCLYIQNNNASNPAVKIQNVGGECLNLTGADGIFIDTTDDGIMIDADGIGCQISGEEEGLRLLSNADYHALYISNSGTTVPSMVIQNVGSGGSALGIISNNGTGAVIQGSTAGLSILGGTSNGVVITSFFDHAIEINQNAADKACIYLDCDQAGGGKGILIDGKEGIDINTTNDCINLASSAENCVSFSSIAGKEDFNPKELANIPTLSTTVDTVTIEYIYETLISVLNGEFDQTELTNKDRITYKKRDNTTTQTVIDLSATGRERVS